MNSVLGSDHTGVEAMSWACYWNELSMYKEELHSTGTAGDVPMVHECLFLV